MSPQDARRYFVDSSQNPWRKPNPKAQDRLNNPPNGKGYDRYQLARLDCECPNCQLLPITRHDPYLLGRSTSSLHTAIELSAVDLNQKGRRPQFDCRGGKRQERGIIKASALAILMLAAALGYAAQIGEGLITQGKELPTSAAVRDLVNALRV